MYTIHRWRILMLLAGLSLSVGGCIALPAAQLASQVFTSGAAGPHEVAQLPDAGGPAQAVHGLKSLLQRGLGAADSGGAAGR